MLLNLFKLLPNSVSIWIILVTLKNTALKNPWTLNVTNTNSTEQCSYLSNNYFLLTCGCEVMTPKNDMDWYYPIMFLEKLPMF